MNKFGINPKRLNTYFLIVIFSLIIIGYFFIEFHAVGEIAFTYLDQLPIVMLLVLIIIILTVLSKSMKVQLEFPILFILLMFFIYLILGLANSYSVLKLWPKTKLRIADAVEYMLYGLSSACMGLFVISALAKVVKSKNKKRNYIYIWDPRRVRKLVYILFSVVAIATLGFFSTGGYLLMIKSEALDLYGPTFIMESGKIYSFLHYMGNYFLCLLSGMYLLLDRRRISIWIVFLVSLLILLLGGTRTNYILILIIIFFSSHYYLKRVRLRTIIGFSLITLVLYFLFGWIRSGLLKNYGIGELLGFDNIFFSLMYEFTTFARLLYEYPYGEILEKGTFLSSAILQLFPRQFWLVFGIEKVERIEFINPALYLAKFLGAGNVGLRVGIVGELFLEFGLRGILIGMFCFGVILGIINYALLKSSRMGINIMIYNFVCGVLVYSIVGQSNIIFSFFYYTLYFFGFAYLICRRRCYIAD